MSCYKRGLGGLLGNKRKGVCSFIIQLRSVNIKRFLDKTQLNDFEAIEISENTV